MSKDGQILAMASSNSLCIVSLPSLSTLNFFDIRNMDDSHNAKLKIKAVTISSTRVLVIGTTQGKLLCYHWKGQRFETRPTTQFDYKFRTMDDISLIQFEISGTRFSFGGTDGYVYIGALLPSSSNSLEREPSQFYISTVCRLDGHRGPLLGMAWDDTFDNQATSLDSCSSIQSHSSLLTWAGDGGIRIWRPRPPPPVPPSPPTSTLVSSAPPPTPQYHFAESIGSPLGTVISGPPSPVKDQTTTNPIITNRSNTPSWVCLHS